MMILVFRRFLTLKTKARVFSKNSLFDDQNLPNYDDTVFRRFLTLKKKIRVFRGKKMLLNTCLFFIV